MGLRPGVIAAVFTALYFAAAFVFGPLIDQGSWIRVGRIFLSFFAAVSALVLWIVYGVCRARKPKRTTVIVLVTAIVFPFVVTFGTLGLLKASQDYAERKTARQLTNSRLSNIHDEALLGPKGHPIGVRVIFTVAYGQGLDDNRYGPIVTVHLDDPVANLVWHSVRVNPPVTGAYPAGEYVFTEDFVPVFEGVAAGGGECLRWSNGRERDAALRSPPQQYDMVIDPFHSRTRTANLYALKAFYEGELAEGIPECP